MIGEEIEAVQAEADEIEPGWGQQIWRMASELRQVRTEFAAMQQLQAAHQFAHTSLRSNWSCLLVLGYE